MYTIAGRIYGNGSPDGLASTSITEVGTTRGVSTSADGSFVFIVPSAATMIKISHVGFIDRIMTAGSFNQFETLDSLTQNLNEVAITDDQRKDNTLLYVAIALTAGAVIAWSLVPKPQKVTV